ncbi:MAG: hypothetical protein ABSF94_02500 [Steroidobacteraceae bacterium]
MVIDLLPVPVILEQNAGQHLQGSKHDGDDDPENNRAEHQFFAGSGDLLLARTLEDRKDDSRKQGDADHQHEENANAEALAIDALDAEIDPGIRRAQRENHHRQTTL